MDSFYHGWDSCYHGIQSVIEQVHSIIAKKSFYQIYNERTQSSILYYKYKTRGSSYHDLVHMIGWIHSIMDEIHVIMVFNPLQI